MSRRIVKGGMMSFPTYRRLIHTIQIVIASIILLPWVVETTPPQPSHYHQYKVSGIISRDSSGDLRNHVAVLYAKHKGHNNQFILLNRSGYNQKYSDQLGLSDSTGSFTILETDSGLYDSLMIAVMAPDRPTIFSVPFQTDTSNPIVDVRYNSREGGCSCGTSSETETDTVGYIYTVPTPINVKLPY
jgi:hypothetical protein